MTAQPPDSPAEAGPVVDEQFAKDVEVATAAIDDPVMKQRVIEVMRRHRDRELAAMASAIDPHRQR